MNLLIYLIKVLVFSGLCYGYYYAFLRDKNFHRFNHLFLLATVMGSIMIGFIKIPIPILPAGSLDGPVKTLSVISKPAFEVKPGEAISFPVSTIMDNLQHALNLLYLIITGAFIARIILSFLQVRKLTRKYDFERIGNTRLFLVSEPGAPFSFFNAIFWDVNMDRQSAAGQQVFRHECYHVEKKHSLEILFCELVTAFFWFNPFFFLVKKEIRLLQEFQADEYALTGADWHEYAQLLVHHSLQARPFTVSQYFFHHPIKRRITMITKSQNIRIRSAARILALPALLLVTGAFTIRLTSKNSRLNPASAEKITILVDAGHGGTDAGASSAIGKEKDISLAIAQKIEKLAAGYPVNIVMSREGDYLPGNAADIREGLENRVNLAVKHKADLFISIHMNADDNDPSRNGAQIVISREDRQNGYFSQSKQLGSELVASLKSVIPADNNLLQSLQGVYVLDKAACPAVIVECGFLTNEKDRAFFKDEQNQELIAKKILEGALQYEKNKEK